ncbi:hypothetical protein AB1Y20_010105 [Prymnesium parvum]|uniref:PDZ domain-containing protein n=1 Tax=Prymnesium parvum TaxID=97485 RepID=A0AB34K6H9_PRYPA
MSSSFLAIASARALDAGQPVLGGRVVDEAGRNQKQLRCPRCLARVVSGCGELKQREGAVLCVPQREEASTAADGASTAADGAWSWRQQPHEWWWLLQDFNDVDNGGVSPVMNSPFGPVKLVLCCECQFGPFGYQMEGEALVWLCCDLLCQQEGRFARAEDDATLPPGLDAATLQRMLESGMATMQFHVTFSEQRLGMVLADAVKEDPSETKVVVAAFTELEGQLGPAELGGQIKIGDQVTRVDGRSTRGMDYAAVLDLIVGGKRPIVLHFERRGIDGQIPAQRELHQDWVR